jgi:hypothetical protein
MGRDGKETREYVRHSVNVPLEVSTVPSSPRALRQGVNLSYGGLSFLMEECLDNGQIIHLHIPTIDPPFDANARVVWCRPEGDAWLVGVEFLDSTHAFQSRMVQQVCSIENYRKEVLQNEGRQLTTQEAAAEWIKKYAGRFPD